jgi:hypothetical protein
VALSIESSVFEKGSRKGAKMESALDAEAEVEVRRQIVATRWEIHIVELGCVVRRPCELLVDAVS